MSFCVDLDLGDGSLLFMVLVGVSRVTSLELCQGQSIQDDFGPMCGVELVLDGLYYSLPHHIVSSRASGARPLLSMVMASKSTNMDTAKPLLA